MVGAVAALFTVVPQRGARTAYFATANLLLLGMLASCSLLAPALVHLLETTSLHIFDGKFQGFSLLFLLAAITMVPCSLGALLLVSRMKEPSRTP